MPVVVVVAMIVVVAVAVVVAAVVVVIVAVAMIVAVVVVAVVVIVVVRPEAQGLLRRAGRQGVVVADAELRLVPVQRAAVEVAVVAGDLHRPGVGRGGVGAALHERQPVLRPVREREHRRPVRREQFHRRGRVPGQQRVGVGDADPGVHAPLPVSDVRERLRHLRRGREPPAVFLEARRAAVERPGPRGGAVRGRRGESSEGAPGNLAAEPGVIESVLETEHEGAAETVQAVGRVGPGAELHAVDGELRQEVELHRVAERLVDADSVLVHGDALRQAEQRRGGEAPEAERRLERVGGRSFEGDRAEALVERVGHRGRAARREVSAVEDGHRRGDPVPADAGPGQRGDTDHVDPLGERRQRQRHVEDRRLPGGQPHALPALRLEAAQREGHGPGPGREGQHVPAGPVGGHGGRRARRRARRHRHARRRGALRVGHHAGQRSGLRRARRRGARAQDGRSDRGESEEAANAAPRGGKERG